MQWVSSFLFKADILKDLSSLSIQILTPMSSPVATKTDKTKTKQKIRTTKKENTVAALVKKPMSFVPNNMDNRMTS